MAMLQGFILGTSLCASLGPQSLFVLRQGMRGEAPFRVALICTLADFALIIAAIVGAETLVDVAPGLDDIVSWTAVIFILGYGCFTLIEASRRPPPKDVEADAAPRAIRTVATVTAAALALSLLNPQVYMEVMVTVGLVSQSFPAEERWLFGLGFAAVSPLWFFGLVMGGRKIAPLFARRRVWRAVDLVTGLAMIVLALAMIGREFGAP
jgi:L-lysine exporter family protein LysE/ArgO